MPPEHAGNAHSSDNSECLEYGEDSARSTGDHGRTGGPQRRGGVRGGQVRGRGTMQDKQVQRWCSNSEILCRVFTAYLTVWLGWALPQLVRRGEEEESEVERIQELFPHDDLRLHERDPSTQCECVLARYQCHGGACVGGFMEVGVPGVQGGGVVVCMVGWGVVNAVAAEEALKDHWVKSVFVTPQELR
ncbi:hypothetical protein GWK47_048163 [Chionoecetes opilio]|uniref:Uncharacterized protein n=1 Tax=Chionoecetes opilio TaxID=41210 RepID=A0A8J4YBB5_CHIOP|nr:hypothetical protein GWK47_048163 [Chionoecetes opilio]